MAELIGRAAGASAGGRGQAGGRRGGGAAGSILPDMYRVACVPVQGRAEEGSEEDVEKD